MSEMCDSCQTTQDAVYTECTECRFTVNRKYTNAVEQANRERDGARAKLGRAQAEVYKLTQELKEVKNES